MDIEALFTLIMTAPATSRFLISCKIDGRKEAILIKKKSLKRI